MKRHMIPAALVAATVLLAAGCSGDDQKPAASSAPASSSSQPSGGGDPSGGGEPSASTESSSAPTSEAPKDANGRDILPDTAPAGFTVNDTSKPFKYGYIVDYQNKYPGWVALSTEAPIYDASVGGYRVNVYFNANAGSDIILRDEFTMIVDGQSIKPEPLEPTGSGGTTDWLPGKTPIGNRPDSTQNYAFGDVVFKMAETQSPLEMHYDNKDGDVHIVWSPNATD